MREFATDLDAAASVRVLAWLHNPELLAHGGVLRKLLPLARVVVGFLELVPTQVLHSVLDVEGQGQVVKGRLLNRFIIDLHVVEDGLFV